MSLKCIDIGEKYVLFKGDKDNASVILIRVGEMT